MMLECNGGMKNTFTSMPLSAEEVLTYRSKKIPQCLFIDIAKVFLCSIHF